VTKRRLLAAEPIYYHMINVIWLHPQRKEGHPLHPSFKFDWMRASPLSMNRGNNSGELFKLWRTQGFHPIQDSGTKRADVKNKAKGVKEKQYSKLERIAVGR
jgi:hypothetical protein